ncbi:MAG TPA: amino acid ABC transporter permease [Deltaproteobacteria bacterium]|nr:amino acid ABC transporter permease [Deltaproteobacteria bacterium]
MHAYREVSHAPRRLSGSRTKTIDLLLYILLMAAGLALVLLGAERLGYHWQWYRIPRYLVTHDGTRAIPGPLLNGLIVTFQITAISLVAANIIGLLTALFRVSGSLAARAVSRAYLEFFRNTPLLTQLLFIYFVLAPMFELSAFASAVLGLSLFEGAYISEIIRSGIVSIHKGQWEASSSLGLNTRQTYVHVILPQALRRVLPPLTSQAISLIKDSSLVSVIAIYDLTMRASVIVSETFLTFEIWFTVAAIYLTIAAVLSAGAHALEVRLKGKFA